MNISDILRYITRAQHGSNQGRRKCFDLRFFVLQRCSLRPRSGYRSIWVVIFMSAPWLPIHTKLFTPAAPRPSIRVRTHERPRRGSLAPQSTPGGLWDTARPRPARPGPPQSLAGLLAPPISCGRPMGRRRRRGHSTHAPHSPDALQPSAAGRTAARPPRATVMMCGGGRHGHWRRHRRGRNDRSPSRTTATVSRAGPRQSWARWA